MARPSAPSPRLFLQPLLLFMVLVNSGSAGNWPQYRGANHDGVSSDRILQRWEGSVTNALWTVSITNCLGSVAVSDQRVFTQTVRFLEGSPKEVCMALDAVTGAELWARPVDDAAYPEGGVGLDDGPRTTPAVEGGFVFVLTSYLKLSCLNATNGSIVWQKDLRSLYGATVIAWQNAASPVLEDGLIFLNVNGSTTNLMAFRTADGSVAWRSEIQAPAQLTHSTPVLATIGGVRHLIFATQDGLVSVNPASGASLWSAEYPFTYGTSIGASPVVWDDMVFICGAHSYGMGATVVQVTFTNNFWTTRRLWATNNPSSHWMTPVAHDGYLYGQFGIQSSDSPKAQLKCVDMRTGQVRWSTNDFGRGGTLLVNGDLLTLTEKGDLVLAAATPAGYSQRARCRAIPDYNQFTNKCWNVPAISDGRVYVRSSGKIAAFDFSSALLKVDPPQFLSSNTFTLTIRALDGTSLSSNRPGNIQIRGVADLGTPVSSWLVLTNELFFSNGVFRMNNVKTDGKTQRFFSVAEP